MPLTDFQKAVARLLATDRAPDSHLAGGAALHFAPNSKRFSHDLDFFHDSVEGVAEAFEKDRGLLLKNGYRIELEIKQPGYIRVALEKNNESTKIEWAHDSAWRFMPPLFHPETGFMLHPVDVAVNKALALAGRDEARDFIDIHFIHREILPLGALCWAAAGKDPGFSPLSLLELLKRRGKYRPEDFARLMLAEQVDLPAMKTEWLEALACADRFIRSRPFQETGCLYYSKALRRFIAPDRDHPQPRDVVPHYGKPGGVLPALFSGDALADQLGLLTRPLG